MRDEKDDMEPGEIDRTEIERYRAGMMSPAEQHALEKKALSDPFLADALEGAESISEQAFFTDVSGLSKKLRRSKLTAWLVPLRIAAGVVMVIASGSLFLYLNQSEPSSLALEKSASPSQTFDSSAFAQRDSASKLLSLAKPEEAGIKTKPSLNQPTPTNSVRDDKGTLAAVSKSSAGGTGIRVNGDEEKIAIEAEISDDKKEGKLESAPLIASAPAGAGVTDKRSSEPSRSARAKDVQALSRSNQTIAGRVTSADNGSALPGVNVVVKGSDEGAVTDVQGNYQLSTQHNNPQLIFYSIGREHKEVNTQNQPQVDVQMNSDEKQRSEIAVTGPPVNQEVTARDDHSTTPAISLAQPVGGREAFQKYLETKIQYPARALAKRTEGKVTIEFTLTPAGELNSFRILKGIGEGCDEELIRLIKEGPRWMPTLKNAIALQDKVVIQLTFSLPR